MDAAAVALALVSLSIAAPAAAAIETNGVVVQARIERGLRKVEKSIPFPMSQMDGSRLLSLAFSVGVWLPTLRR